VLGSDYQTKPFQVFPFLRVPILPITFAGNSNLAHLSKVTNVVVRCVKHNLTLYYKLVCLLASVELASLQDAL